jgi:ABC-type branched-subunit amino acid transport system ATPase component
MGEDGAVTELGSPERALLEVHDLTVAYGRVPALSRFSLSVAPGAVVAVTGESGAGKTTLLRTVSGLLGLHGGRVTEGRVAFDGRSLLALPAARVVGLGVSYVLEGRRVFRDLTVEENLRAGAFTLRHGSEVRPALERVLDQFPLLARRRTTQAGYLSGGEQQLLVMARALVASPRLLLLDDPALGLAPVAIDTVAEVVLGLARAGTGVVLAERSAGGYGETGLMARACDATPVSLERPIPAPVP